MTQVAAVGVLALGQPHALARITRETSVFRRSAENLAQQPESVSIVGVPTSSARILATHARTADAFTSMTGTSLQRGLTRLPQGAFTGCGGLR